MQEYYLLLILCIFQNKLLKDLNYLYKSCLNNNKHSLYFQNQIYLQLYIHNK